jgi:hypothetical protein
MALVLISCGMDWLTDAEQLRPMVWEGRTGTMRL